MSDSRTERARNQTSIPTLRPAIILFLALLLLLLQLSAKQ